jgi:PKHD-type hydroxylase
MQLPIHAVLSTDDITKVLTLLRNAPAGEGWIDGAATSGQQSAQVKSNQQMPEHGKVTQQARDIVVSGISRHPRFMTAALPRRLYPPNFNRYSGSSNTFGAHIDNALRTLPGAPGFLRTDLSCTLFLSEPQSYDGGELVIQGAGGE